jgi:competence protein ComEA
MRANAHSAAMMRGAVSIGRGHWKGVLMSNSFHSHRSGVRPRALRHCIQVLIASLLPVLAWAGPVDINKADAATIAKELNGIGLNKAQAIVAYREKNGNFKSLEDLRKVKGIGVKTLDRNRANIRLDGAAPK